MVVYCGYCGVQVDPEDRDVVLVQKMERSAAFGNGGPDVQLMEVGLPDYFHDQHAPRGWQYRVVS